jgi:hypothetical protein
VLLEPWADCSGSGPGQQKRNAVNFHNKGNKTLSSSRHHPLGDGLCCGRSLCRHLHKGCCDGFSIGGGKWSALKDIFIQVVIGFPSVGYEGIDYFAINRRTKIDHCGMNAVLIWGVVVRGDCDGIIPLFCSGAFIILVHGLDLCPTADGEEDFLLNILWNEDS